METIARYTAEKMKRQLKLVFELRKLKFGEHADCVSCEHSCKVAVAPGLYFFYCAKRIEKNT